MKVDSGPNNDESCQNCQMVRARPVRRRGIREEPASERPSSAPTSPEPGGHGLGRTAYPSGRSTKSGARGCGCQGGELAGRRMSSVREAMVKACGVAMAMVQGHSWITRPQAVRIPKLHGPLAAAGPGRVLELGIRLLPDLDAHHEQEDVLLPVPGLRRLTLPRWAGLHQQAGPRRLPRHRRLGPHHRHACRPAPDPNRDRQATRNR